VEKITIGVWAEISLDRDSKHYFLKAKHETEKVSFVFSDNVKDPFSMSIECYCLTKRQETFLHWVICVTNSIIFGKLQSNWTRYLI
jgi:hypothetical protein